MRYSGTYFDNRRPVITTAPDCLVYLNGELSLPSGGNAGKRVNIQPMISSVSVQTGMEQSPSNAQVSMHIPRHHLDDFFRGGHLILTTMMEIRIFMKGHFLVGGAPRYYPVFWGVVTSVNHTWSGGEQVVDLACQDILYWWSIQRINIKASLMGQSQANQGSMNLRGNGHFTNQNPFDIMYSLARFSYGDAMNASVYLGNQARTEPNPAEQAQLMYYWTKRLGRITHALKMYGPNGDVIQGSLLAEVLSEQNRQAAFAGKSGFAKRNRAPKYNAFTFGEVNLTEVAPFAEILSRIGSVDVFVSEFQTKKEIADIVRQTIGYEFFMDVTGELVFKPPFYNLDVRANKPVSWIRPIDIINESYAENPADVTFIEGTGSTVRNLQIDMGDEVKPKATYADYRLIQKYGWKPGTFNSEFIGSGGSGGDTSRNLFSHLVDHLDRQNARIHTGSVTIPIRPELRLGYPIYHETKDSYYYVENIAHQFSYSGQCTTTLTMMAKRSKFYGAFPYWNSVDDGGKEGSHSDALGSQPPSGEYADPSVYPTNIYKRPLDPYSGTPVGDKNVILTPVVGVAPVEPKEKTSEEQENEETRGEEAVRDLVSFRTQFRALGDHNYAYQIDPSRDEEDRFDVNGVKIAGAIRSLLLKGDSLERADGSLFKASAITFPVSDEGGYEHMGAYPYGRGVRITTNGFDFLNQGDARSRALLHIRPDLPDSDGAENRFDGEGSNIITNVDELDTYYTSIDPNNYGRRLNEIQPTGADFYNDIGEARGVIANTDIKDSSGISGTYIDAPNEPNYRATDLVGRWRANGVLEAARQAEGVTEQQYPDALLLAFIQVESAGRANAKRPNSQFNGLVQIGKANAAEFGSVNTSFQGRNENDTDAALRSLIHLIRYQEKYRNSHQYQFEKQALLWKGGPGTLKAYNEKEKEGLTQSQLLNWLATLPSNKENKWRADVYIRRMQKSGEVWGGPTRDLYQPTELVIATEEEANLVNDIEIVVDDFEEDIAASTSLFARALADDQRDSLPSDIQPIRDPSLIPHINAFLAKIYEEAHKSSTEIEKRLRGETRRIIRPRDLASTPTFSQPSQGREGLIDTPLNRQDVKEALERGETPSQIMGQGSGGRWDELEKKWERTVDDSVNVKAKFDQLRREGLGNDDEGDNE